MALWLPAAIGAGASLIGGLFNNKSQSDTNKANMELAKYQNDFNLDMWNRNNEYNTPQAQMARYQAAGLNPNLIYGNGSSSTGNSSSPVKSVPMKVDPYTGWQQALSSSVNGFLQMALASSNIRKNEAEAKAAESHAESASLGADFAKQSFLDRLGLISSNRKISDTTFDYATRTLDNRILSTMLNANLLGSRLRRSDIASENEYTSLQTNTEKLRLLRLFGERSGSANLNNLLADFALKRSSAENVTQQSLLNAFKALQAKEDLDFSKFEHGREKNPFRSINVGGKGSWMGSLPIGDIIYKLFNK